MRRLARYPAKCWSCVLQLAASLLACIASVSAAQRGAPPPLGRLVDVGGYRVHLYCTGQGSPTVVITGAGASFDWGLVQPTVAQQVQVCAYDHSGTTWSDIGPPDACSLRVSELHAALKGAGIVGPFILVGHSVGALVSRLFAATYPKDVVGMVIVDHAANFPVPHVAFAAPLSAIASSSASPGHRGTLSQSFQALPSRDLALHNWATLRPGADAVLRRSASLVPSCTAAVEALTKGRSHPLEDKPLVVLHTDPGDPKESPGASRYLAFEAELAALSSNSATILADHSTHFIMLDRPDLVIGAIGRVIASVRTQARVAP